MPAFLEFGGILFWAIIGTLMLFNFLAAAIDDEGWFGWGVALTLIGGVYAFLASGLPFMASLAWLVVSAVAYLCCGVIWSFKKWINYIKAKKLSGATRRPTASESKELITGWMLLWPWSLTWWVLTWPRHAFVWAFNRLRDQFDAMAKRIWES